VRVVFGFL